VAEIDLKTIARARRRSYERSRRRVRYALLFLALALLANALIGENGLTALWQSRRQYAQLQGEMERLRVETARLREEARRLREDPSAIEAYARSELGLIRPGERVIVVAPAPRQPVH